MKNTSIQMPLDSPIDRAFSYFLFHNRWQDQITVHKSEPQYEYHKHIQTKHSPKEIYRHRSPIEMYFSDIPRIKVAMVTSCFTNPSTHDISQVSEIYRKGNYQNKINFLNFSCIMVKVVDLSPQVTSS